MIFRVIFWLRFLIDVLRLVEHLGTILGDSGSSCWLLFVDFAKKGAHHGFIGHGGEIKGPAAEQARKKAENMEGKTVEKQAWKDNDIFINFGIMLGAFWGHFGSKIGPHVD